jgi:predicted histone-like DNA-binding protein
MPVIFKTVARGNPSNPAAPKKWYAILKSLGLITEKEVAKLMADETTLNNKEAEMALSQFEKIMLRLLLDGHSVQLGDWGSFHLTCHSEGFDTPEEVTAHSVKELNIRFRPGPELKEAIQRATLVSAGTITG